jgi:hypothetical protein
MTSSSSFLNHAILRRRRPPPPPPHMLDAVAITYCSWKFCLNAVCRIYFFLGLIFSCCSVSKAAARQKKFLETFSNTHHGNKSTRKCIVFCSCLFR